MMKNFCKHINRAGMALLLVLSACSGDGVPGLPDKTDDNRVPLRVSGATAGNGGLDIQTRADATRKELTTGSSIGIFLKEDAANGYSALNNLLFTYGTPFWQTEEQILLGDAPAELAAYYPYSAGRVNPVLLRSQRYSTGEDLHYINFKANNEVAGVTLDLSRVYSLIVFNFQAHPSYTGAGKVTAIHFDGDGIIPVAMLDMLDLSVQNVGGSVRDILDPFTGLHVAEISGFTTQFDATTPDTADCLMIPARLTGEITFTAIVDGIVMTGTVTAEQLCGVGGILMEGVKYEVNITVKLTRLEIGSISKTEWEPIDVDGDYVIQ